MQEYTACDKMCLYKKDFKKEIYHAGDFYR